MKKPTTTKTTTDTTTDGPTTSTTKTKTTETTTVVKVPRIDLTEAALLHFSDDATFLAPIVGVLCQHGHFVGGLLVGSPEAVCITMAIGIATGNLTQEQAMSVIRETERETGAQFGLESWHDVFVCLQEIARTLTISGAAVMETAAQYEDAQSQQTTLH